MAPRNSYLGLDKPETRTLTRNSNPALSNDIVANRRTPAAATAMAVHMASDMSASMAAIFSERPRPIVELMAMPFDDLARSIEERAHAGMPPYMREPPVVFGPKTKFLIAANGDARNGLERSNRGPGVRALEAANKPDHLQGFWNGGHHDGYYNNNDAYKTSRQKLDRKYGTEACDNRAYDTSDGITEYGRRRPGDRSRERVRLSSHEADKDIVVRGRRRDYDECEDVRRRTASAFSGETVTGRPMTSAASHSFEALRGRKTSCRL